MRHSGKALRSFVAANQVILFNSHHGSQGIPNDHYFHAVFQRRAGNVSVFARGVLRKNRAGTEQNEGQKLKHGPGHRSSTKNLWYREKLDAAGMEHVVNKVKGLEGYGKRNKMVAF